jgi:pyruvate,water dikinase
MAWFRKIFQDSNEGDSGRLLNLRCTRFRQLLRNYGRILDRLADAAEKQSGEYILDRQYIVSLAEIVIDLAESVIFDLNVIAENQHSAFHNALGKFSTEARRIIANGTSTEIPSSQKQSRSSPGNISPNRLAKAIDSAHVLFRNEGHVACRGVAAGAVYNLETAENPSELPNGAVMVAAKIQPDDELIRVMKKASAILADFGEPAGDAAILAREFHIPMIVGVRSASSRLQTGGPITVDADENIIYEGRVQELLDYYGAERIPAEEEPEYKLLRKLRQAMFPLTLTESSAPIMSPDDCRSIHDLVHLSSELAGDALTELAVNRRDLKNSYTNILTGYKIPVRVVDVGDGLLQPVEDGNQPDLGKVRSLPLLAFVSGLKEVNLHIQNESRDFSAASILATIKEEHANIIILQPHCHDIVDALIGESKESNHLYCRFAATIRDKDFSGRRGVLTRGILSRLNFAVAQTARASSAWITGLPLIEMKDLLTILGRLSAFLMGMDAVEEDAKALDRTIEEFMEQYA